MEQISEISNDFIPRFYQNEILDAAIKSNSIVYLPTGSGKTFIAMMLVKHLAKDILPPNNKKTALLVNTVTLVTQHAVTFKKHTEFEIGCYSGDQEHIDAWDLYKWNLEFSKHQVLIITAQILLDILRHGYAKLSDFNLLIFDECHQAVSDHPMRQIMQLFQTFEKREQPKVLGLTATLINKNLSLNMIMNEVETLEKTFHATVATAQEIAQIVGFCTNPRESIIYFTKSSLCEVIHQVNKTIEDTKDFFKKIISRENTTDSVEEDCNGFIKKIIKLLDTINYHLENLGIYAGYKIILICMVECERMKKRAETSLTQLFLMNFSTKLSLMMKCLHMVMNEYMPREKIMNFSSDQVLRLINLFEKYKLDVNNDLCSLVFVTRRMTAKVLYFVLSDLAKYDSKMSFLKCNFIVGVNAPHNFRAVTREYSYLSKINKKIIEDFKNKRINVLFASNVAEEGLDIPKCSMVIKFDKPMDYRAYIQSKGRARSNDSDYIILVPSDEQKAYQNKYKNFHFIEDTLQSFLIGKTSTRDGPTETEIRDELYLDYDIPSFYPVEGSTIHISSVAAISLVNRYIMSLSNRFVSFELNWILKTEGNNFIVGIQLPIICPIKEIIWGEAMQSKCSAKRSAAMEVCKLLYINGELNSHCLPKTKQDVEMDFNYLFSNHWYEKDTVDQANDDQKNSVQPKIGTKKFLREYKIAPVINVSAESNCFYLHIVHFKCDDNTTVNYHHQMIESDIKFGLLTEGLLPKICEFLLYSSKGNITVNIEANYSCIVLTPEELFSIKKFNYFVYNDILQILNNFVIYKNSNFISIVPLKLVDSVHSIAFDLIENCEVVSVEEPSIQTKLNLVVTDEFYKHKIVTPWYRTPEKYIVESVSCYTSKSNFQTSDFDSYISYYNAKYNIKIENPDLCLLHVNPVPTKLNYFITSNHDETRGKKRKRIEKEDVNIYLVPEMCVLQKFSAVLWYKAFFMPSVLHRLTFFLQIRQFLTTISKALNLDERNNQLPLKSDSRVFENDLDKPIVTTNRVPTDTNDAVTVTFIDTLDCINSTTEFEDLWLEEEEPIDINRHINGITKLQIRDYDAFVSQSLTPIKKLSKENDAHFESKLPAITVCEQNDSYEFKNISMLNKENNEEPSLETFAQCFVTKRGNDIMNLERMETLGDSLIKFASTLYLFLNFPNCNEGKLTLIKNKLVSNRNLCYCGIKKNIGGFIKDVDFQPNSNWIPPNFCVPDALLNLIRDKKSSINNLFYLSIPEESQINGTLKDETLSTFNSVLEDLENSDDVNSVPSSMLQFTGKQVISDKTIADSVESLIGLFLSSCGLKKALSLIAWFDILPIATNLLQHEIPSPILGRNVTTEHIDFHIPYYKKLEESLGYQFKNRGYLLQALTHPTYYSNRVTDCYQRLELIGDAVLDFLITCFIFEDNENLTPGNLTDLRAALVNNVIFAVLVAKYGFYKYLKFTNIQLLETIDRFVTYQEAKNFKIDKDTLWLLEEHPLYVAETINVPKALGDLFESLAGAVFLDSGMDLQTTWKVFHRLMYNDIQNFKYDIPKNAVRLLYEQAKFIPTFLPPENVEDAVMVECNVTITGHKYKTFGFAENKTQAKIAAAKIVLRLLKKKGCI